MQLKFLALAFLFNNSLVNGISIANGIGSGSSKYWKVGYAHGMHNHLNAVPSKDQNKYIRIAVVGDSISDDEYNPFEKAA